jgi:hypothetical protein
MSAGLHQIADIARRGWDGREVPIPDLLSSQIGMRRLYYRSHPGRENLDVRPLWVIGYGHEIKAIARERQGVCLDQRSALEFAADHHVAADRDALTRSDRIDRMQLLAEA